MSDTAATPQQALYAALAAAQAELPPAVKDAKNPHLQNRYADLASCWTACRAVLPRHGLAVMQRGVQLPDGKWALQTILTHRDGYAVEGLTPLIYSEAKGLTAMQALGSALTYARRYGLAALVGLTADDDDGNGAGSPPPPTTAPPPPSNNPPTYVPREQRAANAEAQIDRAACLEKLGGLCLDAQLSEPELHRYLAGKLGYHGSTEAIPPGMLAGLIRPENWQKCLAWFAANPAPVPATATPTKEA